MSFDLLRSPTALDAFLMFLLLVWLGGSATMTIIASLAERRHATAIAGDSNSTRRSLAAPAIPAARKPAPR
ncbi:MAG TPA: hypothetical protein VGN32_03575 [Ktedonobacterales bacterium]|jgi:predicted lipid-binding transport protein (Tim44 family)|nr:hypothetical protein [Ktedonobacterales bacterium]